MRLYLFIRTVVRFLFWLLIWAAGVFWLVGAYYLGQR
jgi:hypothetical protein